MNLLAGIAILSLATGPSLEARYAECYRQVQMFTRQPSVSFLRVGRIGNYDMKAPNNARFPSVLAFPQREWGGAKGFMLLSTSALYFVPFEGAERTEYLETSLPEQKEPLRFQLAAAGTYFRPEYSAQDILTLKVAKRFPDSIQYRKLEARRIGLEALSEALDADLAARISTAWEQYSAVSKALPASDFWTRGNYSKAISSCADLPAPRIHTAIEATVQKLREKGP